MKNLIRKNLFHKKISHCRGAVLVMSLLMLFVLTLIGVSSMNTTTMEEKMSGNTRNRQLAFQAAETAVRSAEQFITSSVNNPTAQFLDPSNASFVDGLYILSKGPSSSEAITSSWWSSNTYKSYAGTLQDIKSAARYTIEYLGETQQASATGINLYGGEQNAGSEGKISTFRITARGTGITDNAVVVIQSHFGKRI